ncbi:MAG: glycosyltransferase family 1 protein [Lachnospiraceae bacterium]|nr:glycosyltransferase family 1 protein [Lachnospiraceae bacterium]
METRHLKILILETRKLSYGSSSVFLTLICGILRERGAGVTHCVINDPEADSALLESFSGKSFDAVIGMNSILPLAECDSGRYLDSINAPFINIIADHPMHVHKYLEVKLKRYYVICIDRHHKEYIEKYYPHIKRTVAVPFGGIKYLPDGEDKEKYYSYSQFANRRYHIFFPATYTPPSYYRQVMEETNIIYVKQAEEIMHAIMDGDTSPVHELYKNITSWKEERFAARMYKARYIDKYIRDCFRDMAVSALLEEGYKVDVAGARWDMYNGRYKDRLVIHRQKEYSDIPQAMANSQVVLNVQPLFTEAPHDRVFNAMANGSAVLSDTCSYIEAYYKKDMLLFNTGNIHESIAGMEDILNNTEKLYKMASGLRNLSENETWHERCARITSFINEILNFL